MRIPLTRSQVQQLTPYFDRVRTAAQLGAPGMLVAQISWNQAEELYWMTPGWAFSTTSTRN